MRARLGATGLALLGLAGSARAQLRDASLAPAAGEAVTLRLRYAPGVARYSTRTVQFAGPNGARSVSAATIAIETLGVTDRGEARRRLRFERMTLENAALPADARARVSRGLAGASVGYTQNARGEITAREPLSGVADELRPVLEAVMQSLDQMGAQLPEGPVRVGDRWSERHTMHLAPLPGMNVDLRYETGFTLRALRPDGTAVLGVAVTLATPEGATLAGMPFRGEGSAQGETLLDLARGLVRESHTAGSMNVHVSPRGQREVTIPSRFENEMRLEPPPAR